MLFRSEKDKLKQATRNDRLTNVQFIDSQPKEIIQEFYNSSDICLIPLKNIELFKAFIPSKMFEIMACGVPIIASLEGEAAQILKHSNAAKVVKPDNSDEIAAAILYLINNKDEYNLMKANGPEFVEKNYSRDKLAEKYLELLKYVHGGGV